MVWLAFVVSCHLRPVEEQPVNQPAITALETSSDPWALADAAKALAKSQDRGDQAAIGRALAKRDFLDRIDTAEDYQGPSRHLRVAGVMKQLGENPSEAARETLVTLCNSDVYQEHPARVDLLIDALALVRPASPEAIAFWDRHSQVDDGFVNRTIAALSTNQSPPAIALFEKKVADPQFDPLDVTWWIQRYGLPMRNQVAYLQASQRLLAGPLNDELRAVLAESLFDFKPKIWFTPHDVPKCPDRALAGRPALELLEKLATYCLDHVPLTPDVTLKITAERTLLRERLDQ